MKNKIIEWISGITKMGKNTSEKEEVFYHPEYDCWFKGTLEEAVELDQKRQKEDEESGSFYGKINNNRDKSMIISLKNGNDVKVSRVISIIEDSGFFVTDYIYEVIMKDGDEGMFKDSEISSLSIKGNKNNEQ